MGFVEAPSIPRQTPRRRRWILWSTLAALMASAPACKKAGRPSETNAPSISSPDWRAGERFAYGLELSSVLALGESPLLELELRSELLLECRSLTGGKIQFAALLPDPHIDAKDDSTRAQVDALTAELKKPFVFILENGALREVRLAPAASRFAASITQTVAAAVQFTGPSQGGDTWTATESDGTGRYQAEYRRTGASALLSKHKLRYETLSMGQSGLGQLAIKVTPNVVSSRGSVEVSTNPGQGAADSERVLASVAYEEKLQTHLTQSSQLVSQTKLKLRLSRREKSPAPVDWTAALAATRAVAPGIQASPANASDYDAARIGNMTFETALRELEAQAQDPRQSELNRPTPEGDTDAPDASAVKEREARLLSHSRVFTAMASLLRTDPRHVTEAAAKIRSRSSARRLLIDALASAGTPEAQHALVGLMDDRKLDASVRAAAAFSLPRTEHATPETTAALQRYVDDDLLRVHALYGLGTICRRLRQSGETARADAVAQVLIRALGDARIPSRRVDALRAIANSGHPSAFDAVRPFLSDRTVSVQAAAVDAIRLMPLPDVDGIVAERLKNGERAVQTAALDAIAVRDPSDVLVAALAAAATGAAEAQLRLRSVRIMGQWLTKRPELKTSLQRVASDDQNANVQQAAKAALGS